MRRLAILAVSVVAFGLGAFWIATMPATVPASALAPHRPDLGNGRTMFFAGGCPACHATPDQDDRTRLGGGVAIKLAVGTFYAPNISPDPNDGIGRWSEADFVTAMQLGTSPARTHYFPVFPYPSYRNMKREDVRDLFAYLKTLPPVGGRAHDHDVRFPLNIRRSLGGWKFLFVDGLLGGEPFRPDSSQSPAWNRGAYLVNGPGHCAECHSPRNILGGIKRGQRFAGAPEQTGDGWVPNITQKGLGAWSERDIAYLLETGDTPEGDSVGGDMAKVVRNTSQLDPQDRAAIATYIKSLPPVEGPTPPPKKAE